jgi:hypothetical protein
MNYLSEYNADDAVTRCFGAQLHSLAADDNSDGLDVRTHTFENASPVPWREVYMTNADGNGLSLEYDKGNFRVELAKQRIVDDSNPFEYATATAPHADFLGAAIAVDDASTLLLDDYQMQVRIECGDDEGPGLLVRVQDDNTFYRINFTAQAVDSGNERPPQGMSIQKCDGRGGGNPVWTELFSETVTPYLYTNYVDNLETFPFDVKVIVTNNAADTETTIRVEVIDDADEAATLYSWEVTDTSNPILTGTVGFSNWGAGWRSAGDSVGVKWSGYGGDVNAPLVIDAPSPTAIPGDCTNDGVVNQADAEKLAGIWGDSVTPGVFFEGDFDGDGLVGPGDAAIMAANWGYGTESESGSAVPEPGMFILLLGGLIGLLVIRQRN